MAASNGAALRQRANDPTFVHGKPSPVRHLQASTGCWYMYARLRSVLWGAAASLGVTGS